MPNQQTHVLNNETTAMVPIQLIPTGDGSHAVATLPASFEPIELVQAGQRTATHTSEIYTTPGATGLLILISIATASGTGGIRPVIRAHDPITGAPFNLYPDAAAPLQTSTGPAGFLLHPNAGAPGGHIAMAYQRPLPPRWSVHFIHGDDSPYTYRATAIPL